MAWTRLSHVALSSAGDILDTGTITGCHKLRVVIHTIASGGNIKENIRFNSDSGNNYNRRRSNDGAADSSDTSQAQLEVYGDTTEDRYLQLDITNKADKWKLIFGEYNINTAGASNAPSRSEWVGKWQNTSAQITQITVTNDGSGSYDTGSYITVFGDAEDGTEDEKTTLTNVEAGTRYEETDTRKIYRRTAGATVTFSDDFSGTDGWTDSDSSKIGVNTTDNDLDFNMMRDGSNDTCVYDLTSVSNDKWVLRFKINFSAISGGSANGNDIWVGLSDKDESAGSTTSQDFIGIDMNMDGTNVMRSATTNDGTFPLGAGSSTVNWTPSTSTDYYVQIIRTSSTNATIDIFSDSSYSTKAFTTLSYSVSSSTQSLRYIKIANRVDSGGGRTITGIIDDVKFYNGASKVDAEWKERGTA